MDIKSPYIKNKTRDFEEIKNRITKRANSGQNINSLPLSENSKEVSDDLLERKIEKISKRVVGEEIRRFAEVASSEISSEFTNIENRLEEKISILEEEVSEKILLQEGTLSLVEGKLEAKIDTKLEELNFVLSEMEERIKDLEIFSLATEEKDSKKEIVEELVLEEKEEDVAYSLNFNKADKKDSKTKEEKDVKLESPEATIVCAEVCEENLDSEDEDGGTLECEEVCKVTVENTLEEKEYLKKQLDKVRSLFEKNGFLFKKNIFDLKLKNLIVEEFVNNKDSYHDIESKDKERICNILTDLMDTLTIDPKEDETVENFIERAYSKKYFLEN